MSFLFSFIATIITSLLSGWRRDNALEAKGAADQRVNDLVKENADVAEAAKAAADPVLADLDGVRNDPANRRRKRSIKTRL